MKIIAYTILVPVLLIACLVMVITFPIWALAAICYEMYEDAKKHRI